MSREALADFREKQARTRDFLKAHDVENEDGERISLEDIYYASTSNPHNRRNEMMACVKGMELIAQERGDVAFFVTVTARLVFTASPTPVPLTRNTKAQQ